jgi:hypothetical protein
MPAAPAIPPSGATRKIPPIRDAALIAAMWILGAWCCICLAAFKIHSQQQQIEALESAVGVLQPAVFHTKGATK